MPKQTFPNQRTRDAGHREAGDKPAPIYRKAVGTGERWSARRALKRAGLNLRDEARISGGAGASKVGSAVEELGTGNATGGANFVLVVLGGLFGLLILNLLVSPRGSNIASAALRWSGLGLNRLVSPTDPLIGVGHSTAPGLAGSSSAPAAASTPAPTSVGGPSFAAQPTGRIVPVPGSDHSIDAAYVGLVGYIEKTFKVTLSSGYRTAAQNAAVGGVPTSDHRNGAAGDFIGTAAAMQRLVAWATKAGFPYVETPAQSVAAGEGAHVHISFFRPSKNH